MDAAILTNVENCAICGVKPEPVGKLTLQINHSWKKPCIQIMHNFIENTPEAIHGWNFVQQLIKKGIVYGPK